MPARLVSSHRDPPDAPRTRGGRRLSELEEPIWVVRERWLVEDEEAAAWAAGKDVPGVAERTMGDVGAQTELEL